MESPDSIEKKFKEHVCFTDYPWVDKETAIATNHRLDGCSFAVVWAQGADILSSTVAYDALVDKDFTVDTLGRLTKYRKPLETGWCEEGNEIEFFWKNDRYSAKVVGLDGDVTLGWSTAKCNLKTSDGKAFSISILQPVSVKLKMCPMHAKFTSEFSKDLRRCQFKSGDYSFTIEPSPDNTKISGAFACSEKCMQSPECQSHAAKMTFISREVEKCQIKYKGITLSFAETDFSLSEFARNLDDAVKASMCSSKVVEYSFDNKLTSFVISNNTADGCILTLFREEQNEHVSYTAPFTKFGDDADFSREFVATSFFSIQAKKRKVSWCRRGDLISYESMGHINVAQVVDNTLSERVPFDKLLSTRCKVLRTTAGVVEEDTIGISQAVTVVKTICERMQEFVIQEKLDAKLAETADPNYNSCRFAYGVETQDVAPDFNDNGTLNEDVTKLRLRKGPVKLGWRKQ